MIIDIPEGKDPIGYVWGEMVPGIGLAARQDRGLCAGASAPCATSRGRVLAR